MTNNVNQLQQIAESGTFYDVQENTFDDCMYGEQLRFLRGRANTTYEYSGVIKDAYDRGMNSVQYMDHYFARQMAIIARLIKGNLGTKVFMVSLGGFDTHGNQPARHAELMTIISSTVNTFYQDLNVTDQDKNVLSMTFSEFGRRIFENGSNGTDHGKAAPTMFFGPALQGSAFVGDHPSLEDPNERGNLDYTMDFRDLYATVLAEWLCVPIDKVEQHLLGHTYRPIDLGFNCSGTTFDDIVSDDGEPDLPIAPPRDDDDRINILPPATIVPEIPDAITHRPYYPSQGTPYIHLGIPNDAEVQVTLFNIMGQNIATLMDENMSAGSTEINIKERMGGHLSAGKYIYQVVIGQERMSKTIMVI